MIRDTLHVAIAEAFVRDVMQPALNSRLRSRDVLERCATWCKQHRLLSPSPHEIAAAMRPAHYVKHKSNGQRMWRGVVWRRERDPFAALGEPDILRRLMFSDPVIPLPVFCQLAGVGRSTFYVQEQRGDAPVSYRRGRRIFILAIDAAVWCSQRGRHSSLEAIVDWVNSRKVQGDGL
jgi:predicted DNA-binding transcriptional regulator AlpA